MNALCTPRVVFCLLAILISFPSFAVSLESNLISSRTDTAKPITTQELAVRQQWAMEMRDRVAGSFGASKALLQAMPDFDFASDYLRVVLKLTIEPSGQIKDVIAVSLMDMPLRRFSSSLHFRNFPWVSLPKL